MASITDEDEPDNVEDEVTDKFTRTVDAPPPSSFISLDRLGDCELERH